MTHRQDCLTEPCYETAIRDLLARFGAETLTVVDAAIARLEATGQTGPLGMWRDLRATLLRAAPTLGAATAH